MKPLVILTGATAVGKTELSISLAKAIDGEIISADSIQVYKYMDIGSAKISEDEKQGIPHYLINEFEPNEEFNITIFKEKAKKYIEDICGRGKIPIITGGTGFYIQSVLYEIDFTETKTDHEYRKYLKQLAEKEGPQYIHNMLREVDELSARSIHANNTKRVIRALEFYKETGTPISTHNALQRENTSPYNFIYFVLNDYREEIYKRIDERVEKMFSLGLVSEVKKLKEKGYDKYLVSMQGIGYKEVFDYLDGIYSLDETKYIIKRDTRHFAKRQLTWFKREKCVTMINYYDYDYNKKKMLDSMIKMLEDKGIL